jgi:hypothetical protein
MSDDRPKPIHPATMALMGMAYGLADSLPRRPEGSECERCHQRGFHSSSCQYVVQAAFGEHYNRCKKCKPGISLNSPVDADKVLCPRGRRLYRKAN